MSVAVAERVPKPPGSSFAVVPISVIIPTVGRPESLARLLDSLAVQTLDVQEVLVADASGTTETDKVIADSRWSDVGLRVRRIAVSRPNAVRQRAAAISLAIGEFLLLLDDDVALEPDCVQQMLTVLIANPDVVAVTADFNNQTWSQPTWAWKFYLRYVLGLADGVWQGKVIGPLLHFGYNPVPADPKPMEWLGAGNSLVRRSAFEAAGGFSDFFLHRCTTNEDVDFGLRLSRVGRILFCPAARMAHHHAPGGRVSVTVAAEDDLFNRFMVIHKTMGRSRLRSLALVLCFLSIESLSNVLGACKRMKLGTTLGLLVGRLRGLIQIGRVCLTGR